MTASATESLGSIFTDAAAYADPERWHATAARIRAESPILRVDEPGYPAFWAITKHADVMEIERNADIFTNSPIPALGPKASVDGLRENPPPVQTLIQMDGDVHKKHRAIVNDWFKPGNVKKMQDRIDDLATQYVDRMVELGGTCDFVNDVALHYPLQVIMSLLGLPEEDYGRMLKLTQELFGAEDPDIGRMTEDEGALAVLMDMVTYFTDLAAARRAHPTEDLASVIANATIDGEPLNDLDMMGHYVIIATAGHDTTSNAIGGGLLALLQQPEQLALLREQPEVIDNAADEIIRWVAPVKHFMRNCQQPFTMRGITFQPDDLLLLSFASASRDEEVFADPHRLDVTRANAASHLSFGFGRHFCLGAHLARLEIRAIFRELIGRLDHIELAGDPAWTHAYVVQGPKSIPVTYRFR